MSMFYKKSEPLGTFSSGGHTILNKLKQALTQRTKLMFGGGLKATDNSQDGITLVDDSADEIEFSDWIAKTEEEKEDYAEEHAKFDIINAPGVDELVELKLLTKLWENPSPTATFSAQTVTLNSTDWDFILIMFDAGSNNDALSQITIKGKVTRLISGNMSTNGNSQMQTRTATVSADGASISFTSAYRTYVAGSGSESGVNDGFCKPLVIYGFKTNIKSIISAIASDVSTSASKCMLPDGETSIEDTLNYSADEHVVGKWIDGSTLYEKTIDFGYLPNATSKSVSLGANNVNVIVSVNGVAQRSSDGSIVTLPEASSSNTSYNIELTASRTAINIFTAYNYSAYYAYVTLRYTKTS